ncbi:tetratricopeptide repeat protein [Piscinibacter sp.]|uniref:tetratricopeptide repeat protein n=1 Tax=Piscinibacter sp. TaxID=1903157 RepID=UPI0039E4F9BE
MIDLVESATAEFFSNAVARSATALLNDEFYPIWIQRRHPPGFREQVCAAAHLGADAALFDGTRRYHPNDTCRAVSEAVVQWRQLPLRRRCQAARVLLMLGDYERLGQLLADDGDDPHLRLTRVSVEVGLHRTGHRASIDHERYLGICHAIAVDGRLKPALRIAAGINAFLLTLQYSGRSAASEYEWLVAQARVLSTRDDFLSLSLQSRIWRAAAMHSQRVRCIPRMHREMDRAQQLGEHARPGNSIEAFLRTENLFSVYESRTKEYLHVGDTDRACDYAITLVTMFPQQSAALIELGEVLLARAQWLEAARRYLEADAYAPLGSALAMFMAGEAFRLAGRKAPALAAYVQSQRQDRLAVSSVRQALYVAHAQGCSAPLQTWAERASAT